MALARPLDQCYKRAETGRRPRINEATIQPLIIRKPLLDATLARGFTVETCAMDKGYDNGPIHDGCEERDVRPIIPLRQTPAVKRGEHKPPCCEHGPWRFAGADYSRKATKWRCRLASATRVCLDQGRPAAPADPPRDSALEGPLPGPRVGRAGVRQLKHEWALAPLRGRGIERSSYTPT